MEQNPHPPQKKWRKTSTQNHMEIKVLPQEMVLKHLQKRFGPFFCIWMFQ